MTASDSVRAAAGAASLRPFRAAYWFGGFNGLTWMVILGTPTLLLAEKLGATAFQVGLLSSFVFLFLPLQVISTAFLARLGFRRQMVLAWSVRATFVLVPLALSMLAPEEPRRWLADLLIVSVLAFCIVLAFGIAAHIPWTASSLHDPSRRRVCSAASRAGSRGGTSSAAMI